MIYDIRPEIGFAETQTAPEFSGSLPDPAYIVGNSDVMNPRTYGYIPPNNIVMHGRMEQRTARAIEVASWYAPEIVPAVRLDLLSPEMVSEVDAAVGDDYAKSVTLRTLGARTLTLPDSQTIHRGFYGLPPEISRSVFSRFAYEPHTALDIFAARDTARAVVCDPAEASAMAREIAASELSPEEIVALLALKRNVSDHSKDISKLGDPCNTTDVRTFRYCARTGQVVDPSYLSSPAYQWTASPFDEPQDVYDSIRHMLLGFPGATGNDHIYLYANTPDKPNSISSALADFSHCRPGNYLYHDLKMMELRAAETARNGGKWIHDAPFEIALDYALAHYFGGQQIDLQNLHAGRPSESRYGLEFAMGDNYLQFPLKPVGRIIPQRALRKGNEPAKQYATKNYLAELVDIALQIDKIHVASGRSEILAEPMHQRLLRSTAYLRPDALSRLGAITQTALADGIKPLEISYTMF